MTGPRFRHWLTGFVFAALAHLVLAAFLMGFWREPLQESGSAEYPGVDVTIFPGFHQAYEPAVHEPPPLPAYEPLAPEVAVEPALPSASLPPDAASDDLQPSPAEPALVFESATPVPARPVVRQSTPDTATIPGPVPVAESVAVAPAMELSAGVVPAETVSAEAIALVPESEAEALETPLPSATVQTDGPSREESIGAHEPPSIEATPNAQQIPGIEEQYFRALREWLDRHKDYPRVAQRRGEEGTVVLAFTLNRFGMVMEHAIVRSSGHTMLDNTVEHLIRRAQPLPAIPPEMNVGLLRVIVPIEFRLER